MCIKPRNNWEKRRDQLPSSTSQLPDFWLPSTGAELESHFQQNAECVTVALATFRFTLRLASLGETSAWCLPPEKVNDTTHNNHLYESGLSNNKNQTQINRHWTNAMSQNLKHHHSMWVMWESFFCSVYLPSNLQGQIPLAPWTCCWITKKIGSFWPPGLQPSSWQKSLAALAAQFGDLLLTRCNFPFFYWQSNVKKIVKHFLRANKRYSN